jgi:hypothetical protein
VSTQRGGASGLGSLLATLQGNPANMELARADVFWRSERLAAAISGSDELVRLLLPGRWDEENQTWRPSRSWSARLAGAVGAAPPPRPTVDEIDAVLRQRFRADVQLQSFRTLSMRSTDPEASVKLLEAIIQVTGSAFRSDDLAEVERLLQYSTRRMEEVGIPRQSEVLAQIVMLLEQQRMQVEASRHYLFDIVQYPMADSRPSSPRPLLALAVGAVLPATIVVGLMLTWPSLFRFGRKVPAAGEQASA